MCVTYESSQSNIGSRSLRITLVTGEVLWELVVVYVRMYNITLIYYNYIILCDMEYKEGPP